MQIIELPDLWRQRILFRLPVMLLILIALASCGVTVPLDGMGSESVGAGPLNLQITPQETISHYFEAVNDGDIELMRQLVDLDDESNQIFIEGFEEVLKQGLRIEVTDMSLYVVEETGGMVRIQTNHQQKMTDSGQVVFDTRSGSSFTLVKKDDKWYFIGLGDPIPPGWIIE